MQQPKGPFCQSCSMPMERPEDFGTDANGFKINDYCHYCFQNGDFTDPGITLAQMIDRLVGMADKMGMTEAQARQVAETFLPRLKRWQG